MPTANEPTRLMNITDMIDLSIGAPECGIVDFNMLHTVLHCIVQQINIRDKLVELHGDIATSPVGDMQNVKTVDIDEYNIGTQDSSDDNTMLVVERISKLDADVSKLSYFKPKQKENLRIEAGNKKQYSGVPEEDEVENERESKIKSEDKDRSDDFINSKRNKKLFSEKAGGKFTVVTASKFAELEEVVKDLRERVYGSTPENDDIIREVRSQGNLKTITDLWSSLNVSSRLEATEQAIQKLGSVLQDVMGDSGSSSNDTDYLFLKLNKKIDQLDQNIKECCDGLNKDKGILNDRILNLQEQIEGFTKELDELSKTQAMFPSTIVTNLENVMQVVQTVQEMQTQLHLVHETAQQLASEKATRQMQLAALMEQINMLNAIKIDREDINIAMEDKADVSYCARKVNTKDFEQACDDLTKGLDLAFEKLTLQESIWQNSLDEIQREIESKLDRKELLPVKDFFYYKLQSLQANLKKMADLRREAQAAGSKKSILRNVNCISCDAKVIMSMDPPEPPAPRPAPCSVSMKPYLSYELDNIRKTQKCSIPQRNMHDWEQIEKMTKQPQRVRSDTDKHICNRYCGGNHTVTTSQRVTRAGHFVAQWGPDIVPLSVKMAAGDDGRMYKVSVTESSNVGPDNMKAENGRRKESGKNEEVRIMHPTYAECCCLGSPAVRSEKDSEKSRLRQSLSKTPGAR